MQSHNNAGWIIQHDHITTARRTAIPAKVRQVSEVFVQLREPIGTWGTYFARKQFSTEQLRDHYRYLMELVRENPDFRVHRVEDGLDVYGVKPISDKSSLSTPLRDAIRRRDVRRIKKIGGNDFEYFCNEVCPEIRDFFEEYGYEFWWLE